MCAGELTWQDDDSDEWVDEATLPLLDKAKLVSLRICAHWAIGYAKSDDKLDIAKPVLKLLTEIVYNAGTVNEKTNEG